MSPCEQRAGAVLRRLAGINEPVMAEIGVGVGRMAGVLMREHPTLRLHLVDNFLPVTEQPAAYVATRDNFALRDTATVNAHRAQARAFANKNGDRVVLHEAESREAARCFRDGTLAMVFVDADHSYAGVKRDIAIWLPKVMRGGWIGGHDYGNEDNRFDFSGVKRAVDEFGKVAGRPVELDANFTWFVRL